jgi:hypothetical protein
MTEPGRRLASDCRMEDRSCWVTTFPVSGAVRDLLLRLKFQRLMFEIAVAIAEETRPWAKRGGSFLFVLFVLFRSRVLGTSGAGNSLWKL